MPAHRCPNCGLVNPESAVACDCGYRFATGHVGGSYVPPPKPQQGDGLAVRVATRVAVRVVSVLFVAMVILAYHVCTKGY